MDLRSLKISQFENDFSHFKSDLLWPFFKEHVIPSLYDRKCCFCLKTFSCEFSLKKHYYSFHTKKLPLNVFNSQELNDMGKKGFCRQENLNAQILFSTQTNKTNDANVESKSRQVENQPKNENSENKINATNNEIVFLKFIDPIEKMNKSELLELKKKFKHYFLYYKIKLIF